jgi:peptidoglycan/xylan/chitin deacetylase (PgdA/CDA1 family)
VSFTRGLMFHRFRHEGSNALLQGALSAAEFESILLQTGLENILSPVEWIEKSANGTLAPSHRCITFDDGLYSQFEIALPVLKRFNLQAFWFLYTCIWQGQPVKSEVYSYAAAQLGGMDFLVEKFMARCPASLSEQLTGADFIEYENKIRQAAPFYSNSDIRYRYLRNQVDNRELFEATMDELLEEAGYPTDRMADRLWIDPSHAKSLASQGHMIGLHSHGHPYEISKLSNEEQKSQYRENYDLIFNATLQKPLAVAHPLNSYNEGTLEILKSMGILCGFRANVSAPAGKKVNPNPLEWAREDSTNLISANHLINV